MRSPKNNTLYLSIGLIVAVFFSIFLVETFHYELLKDDVWYKDLLSGKSILGAAAEIYINVNGRWFSHLWDCTVFKLFFDHYHLLFFYHFFLLVCFVLSLALFVRTVFQKQYSVVISNLRSLLLSISLTAFFFFFFFEGRVEVWYWVCATGVHLLSMIALLIVLSYCMKDHLKWMEISLLIVSAMAIGGMSESYAFMSIVVLSLGMYKQFMFFKKTIAIIFLIVLSLLVNVLSSGLESRLSMLPDFNFLLALRNTIHSLLLPFINYHYLPLKAGVIIVTYLFASRVRNLIMIEKKEFFPAHFLKQLAGVTGIVALSFFIPCFLLTDIIAFRMASFAYLFFLLFLFDYFMKYGVKIPSL